MSRFFPPSMTPSRPSLALLTGLLALGGALAPLQAQTGVNTPAPAPINQPRGGALSAEEARAIAKEAWLYAYAPLQGYQTLWNQTQNKAFAGYVGGFNQFRHYARSATPADTDIVTPNNDTPYSWA